jgi:hypothetical protein
MGTDKVRSLPRFPQVVNERIIAKALIDVGLNERVALP